LLSSAIETDVLELPNAQNNPKTSLSQDFIKEKKCVRAISRKKRVGSVPLKSQQLSLH